MTIAVSEENRDVIIDLLLDGYSYREIQRDTDFGKNITQYFLDNVNLAKKYLEDILGVKSNDSPEDDSTENDSPEDD